MECFDVCNFMRYLSSSSEHIAGVKKKESDHHSRMRLKTPSSMNSAMSTILLTVTLYIMTLYSSVLGGLGQEKV